MTRQLPPDGPDSPVFDRSLRMRPQVKAQSGPGLAVGVLGAVALGVIVFMSLSRGRERSAVPPPAPAVATAPVPDVARPMAMPAPVEPVASAAPAPVPPRPSVFVPASAPVANPLIARWRAPAVVVELGGASAASASVPGLAEAARAASPSAPPPGEADRFTADERFAQRVNETEVETAQASRLRDPARTAPQGTVVPAVLETALNSDLPGSLRAVVARDVRGFDGTTVLIPRGSKLIGQYRSAVAQGQTRAFVIWSRLLTPDGVSIDIGSPATDRLGRGGLSGETDTHFLRRFGAAILLSVMSAGIEIAARNESPSAALIINTPQQATRVAEIALQKQIDIPPTIKVAPGTPLQVFIIRDLDFSSLGPPAP